MKTKMITMRLPVHIDDIIQTLIEYGLFKDRTDFIMYAVQKTLLEMIDKVVIIPDEETVEYVLAENIGLSDDEIKRILRRFRYDKDD